MYTFVYYLFSLHPRTLCIRNYVNIFPPPIALLCL